MYYKHEFRAGNCSQKCEYKSVESILKWLSANFKPSHSKAVQEAMEAFGIA